MAVFALLLGAWIAAYWLWKPAVESTEPRVSRAAVPAEPDPALAAVNASSTAAPSPFVLPEPTPPPTSPSKVTRLIPPEFRKVTVQKGDTTFEAVARRELGSAKYAEAISRANPLVSPNKLIAGRTELRIPIDPTNIQGKLVEVEVEAPAKAGSPAQPATTSNDNSSSAKGQTYVVKSDDTLGSIAKRFYGKSAGWQKIYNANRDKITSPERLKPGITIIIPPGE